MRVDRTLSEDDLLLLLKKGSEAALTELYKRYWDKLLYIAVVRLEDEDEAQECVQDVFLALWRNRETLELKARLGTYLSRSIKNRVINSLIKRSSTFSYKQTPIPLKDEPISPAADFDMLEKELMEKIEWLVNTLPDRCRLIFKMKQQEAKGNKEIAHELNITEKTVKVQWTKAVNVIKSNLNAILTPFIFYFFQR